MWLLDMRETIYSAESLAAARADTYGTQALRLPACGLQQGVLAAVEPPESHAQPHD